MSDKPVNAKISPPKRVEIVSAGDSLYWKPGQFGYALSYSTHPGMYTERGPSAAGELSFLVSKTSNMRGGATWFSADALRFTMSRKSSAEVTCKRCKGTGYIYTTRQEACPACDKFGKVMRTAQRDVRDLIASLSDAEKIAVDLLLQRGNGHDARALAELIPDADRRAYVRTIATEIRSHRAR